MKHPLPPPKKYEYSQTSADTKTTKLCRCGVYCLNVCNSECSDASEVLGLNARLEFDCMSDALFNKFIRRKKTQVSHYTGAERRIRKKRGGGGHVGVSVNPTLRSFFSTRCGLMRLCSSERREPFLLKRGDRRALAVQRLGIGDKQNSSFDGPKKKIHACDGVKR